MDVQGILQTLNGRGSIMSSYPCIHCSPLDTHVKGCSAEDKRHAKATTDPHIKALEREECVFYSFLLSTVCKNESIQLMTSHLLKVWLQMTMKCSARILNGVFICLFFFLARKRGSGCLTPSPCFSDSTLLPDDSPPIAPRPPFPTVCVSVRECACVCVWCAPLFKAPVSRDVLAGRMNNR